MGAIDQTADEVAQDLLDRRGGYENYPDLMEHDREIARDAAVLMSQRLNKSVDIDEYFERTIEFQARAVETAQGHNQVFIAVGYAAFFALWSTMASSISELAMLWAGGLMVISVIIFVGWMVAGMVVIKVATERTLATYNEGPVDFYARLVAVEQVNLKSRQRFMLWWRHIVGAAGTTALIAAIVLCYSAGAAILSKSARDHHPRAATAPPQPNAPKPSPRPACMDGARPQNCSTGSASPLPSTRAVAQRGEE